MVVGVIHAPVDGVVVVAVIIEILRGWDILGYKKGAWVLFGAREKRARAMIGKGSWVNE